MSWSKAIERWRGYVDETAKTSLVFQAADDPEKRRYAQRSHRWDVDYQEARYAKLKDMERGIERFYGRMYTGLITLTASSRQVPQPVDHLEELVSGRDAALEALRRSLDGRTWDYWWVLEPHESGYLHLHIAVVAEGRIAEPDLRPAVDAHLRQVPAAGEDAHRSEKALEIKEGAEIDNLGAYLNTYLGSYREDPLDAPEKWQAANAILWATGRRGTGASRRLRGFTQWEGEPEPQHEWSLTAVVDADGEERPVDSENPGGVDTFAVSIGYGALGGRPPPD